MLFFYKPKPDCKGDVGVLGGCVLDENANDAL